MRSTLLLYVSDVYLNRFRMLDTDDAISEALLIAVVVLLAVELLEPERRLERADVAAVVVVSAAVSVVVSVV